MRSRAKRHKRKEEHGGGRHGLAYQAAAGLARLQLAGVEPGEGVQGWNIHGR